MTSRELKNQKAAFEAQFKTLQNNYEQIIMLCNDVEFVSNQSEDSLIASDVSAKINSIKSVLGKDLGPIGNEVISTVDKEIKRLEDEEAKAKEKDKDKDKDKNSNK